VLSYFSPSRIWHRNKEAPEASQDDRASDFTLKDLDGRTVSLSDYKGKTIVLYFMATWCPECRSAIPHLRELYASYNPKGLIFLSIDVMESKEKAAAFSRKYNIPYPILLDEEGKVYRNYGVGGVPVKAFDRPGRPDHLLELPLLRQPARQAVRNKYEVADAISCL